MAHTPQSTAQIRQAFLDYFADKSHQKVVSASLVPANDPTLLFTNAGMVPFKDVFLGAEKRDYVRATSSQRCVRAGGKHNDLDEVGYTARHHTFFEMLGNFSFGDYFKEEAIAFAWEFLTEIIQLSAEKLWVTVFEEDDEAAEIWLNQIGVPAERLVRIGARDNFWAMGDTGPCGPCTEIFYDHGPDVAGGPPGSPDEDGDRYVEIWNLVFMQFDRDAGGTLKPLPKPCVDTGMGLERLAAVLQQVHSNYDIDLFQHLIKAAALLTGTQDLSKPSLRVLADHIRACAFLIVDGVMPGSEGRGYVLRRIIRRAIRHGHQLGADDVFFWKLVNPLVEQMGEAYPELTAAQSKVEQQLAQEETRFRETLARGMELLTEHIETIDTGAAINGATAFKLYDTYGFPLDLTQDVAREHGLQVDLESFETHMQQQRERARKASKFDGQLRIDAELIASLKPTAFAGYEHQRLEAAEILLLFSNAEPADELTVGQKATIFLDQTPFYAESGGQVGDTGELRSEHGVFRVTDTQKVAGNYHAHHGEVVEGLLKQTDTVVAQIDVERRAGIIAHHSATHLLHAALRELLGDHVEQKGSLVAEDRLRFDFSHPQAVTADQIIQLEERVNQQIRANAAADIKHMGFDEAIDAGAMALFGEKYGDQVRVLRFGDFSVELCGGTHVNRVGDIGVFKVISESGVAAGIRRIEAVAGQQALLHINRMQQQLQEVAGHLKTTPAQLVDKIEQVNTRLRVQQQEIERLQSSLSGQRGNDLAAQAVTVNGINLVAADIGKVDPKSLRDSIDQLKQKLDPAVVVLVAHNGQKVSIAAGVSQSITDTYHAGKLVNHVASQLDGKGGGRPDFAQAGGIDNGKIPEVLENLDQWLYT